jgi:hypothetical protein
MLKYNTETNVFKEKINNVGNIATYKLIPLIKEINKFTDDAYNSNNLEKFTNLFYNNNF